MVFLHEFSNFAWVPQHNGWYIDAKGNIYTFHAKRGQPTTLEPPVRVGHVPAGVLARERRLILPASHGTLQTRTTGADMGEDTFAAFLADAKGGSPRRIVLVMRGDLSGENMTPAGQSLLAWLRSVAPRTTP